MPRALIPKWLRRAASIASLGLWVACASGSDTTSAGGKVTDLTITRVAPLALVPGSVLVVEGNFDDLEPAFVELAGSFSGAKVDVLLPATLTGLGRLEVKWQGGAAMGLPGDSGEFVGTAQVNASIPVDPRLHLSAPVSVDLKVATELTPVLTGVLVGGGPSPNGVVQLNGPIALEGEGFLLGASEGRTIAILNGCFQTGSNPACLPVPPSEVPVIPDELVTDPLEQRTTASFPFVPKIAGIEPGLFQGSVRLRNDHAKSGSSAETPDFPVQIQLATTTLAGFAPAEASLGEYVEISGGGFVGKWSELDDPTPQATLIQLDGTFTATGAPNGAPVSLQLVTEWVSGDKVLYVLNEEDALGQAADLRTVTGQFKGTAQPIVSYGQKSVSGDPIQVMLGIAAVKQVVWLNWLPTYKNSLEHFGLRAADGLIRVHIVDTMKAAYTGVNIEFRTDEPRDFKLYAQVDFEGPDPNGLGLLGYDNSPGKDVGNQRLADKMGGVNALTQEGGYPGYGGVFVDSLFGFSKHPGKYADALDIADPIFDQIFDRFRPDRGGHPVLAAELGNVPDLADGSMCPAPKGNRPLGIACAIHVLGAMIGTTAAHEVGHSLGLADPNGEDFHNPGDEPNRLMDAGGARTLKERAELGGEGPGIFCDEDYAYLRGILPSSTPDPQPARPTCY